MIRSTATLIVKHIFHREVAIQLQFPAWEGPVFMVQYLAVCEGTFGLIVLNCEIWVFAGLATFLSIPIMWIAFCYFVLRKHILGDRARFIHFKSLTMNRVSSKLSMGRGCFGKVFACYLIILQFSVRGEWQYKPDSRSEKCSFLFQEYVGNFWFYALTRLFKKVAMSAVLSLTDGIINVILAITLQSCDMICVLSWRPHISRDVDTAECVAAIINTIATIMLGIPVLAPSLAPYSSDFIALCLTMVSVLVSLAPVLQAVARDVIKTLRPLFSVAGHALVSLLVYLVSRSERELRERIVYKYMQDLDLEQKSVRLQMMLESPPSMLTRPSKLEPKGFVQKISSKLGIATAHYVCPLVCLRQAISFVVGVGVYGVTILYCDGPSISTLEQQYEDRALALCTQPTHSGNSRILNWLLMSKFHAPDPKLLDTVVSFHHWNCNDREGQSKDLTTLLDIIVTMDDVHSAQKVVARLQEDTIYEALRYHNFHVRAHVLRPAATQSNFCPAGFVLHPLTQSPAAAVIQGICRRILVLKNFSDVSFLDTLFGNTPALFLPPLESSELEDRPKASPSFNNTTCAPPSSAESLDQEGLIFYKSGLGYRLMTTRAYTSNRNTSEIKSSETRSSNVFKPQTDRLMTFWEKEDQECKEKEDQERKVQNGKALRKSIAVRWQTPSSDAGANVGSIKTDIRGDHSIVDVALIADCTLQRPIRLHRRGADVESALYSPRNMDHMVSALFFLPPYPSPPPSSLSLPLSLPLPLFPSARALSHLHLFPLSPLSLPSSLSVLRAHVSCTCGEYAPFDAILFPRVYTQASLRRHCQLSQSDQIDLGLFGT